MLASEPITYAQEEYLPEIQIQVIQVIEEKSVDELISFYSKKYSVSEKVMIDIIQCESKFIVDVQSFHINKDGEQEDSWGLSQIHLPSHPNITKEQAIDPEFAIEFLAKNLSLENAWMWTCWRIIGEPSVN